MEPLSAKILEQLFGGEKEISVRRQRNPERELSADHWTTPVLLERAAYLRKLAKFGNGLVIDAIKEYPRHSAELMFRSRTSEAEVHEDFGQILFVLDGTATLVSSVTLAGLEPAVAGGDGSAPREGGVRQTLRSGEVAYIPAGLPHRILLSGNKSITCLVFRIQANRFEAGSTLL